MISSKSLSFFFGHALALIMQVPSVARTKWRPFIRQLSLRILNYTIYIQFCQTIESPKSLYSYGKRTYHSWYAFFYFFNFVANATCYFYYFYPITPRNPRSNTSNPRAILYLPNTLKSCFLI